MQIRIFTSFRYFNSRLFPSPPPIRPTLRRCHHKISIRKTIATVPVVVISCGKLYVFASRSVNMGTYHHKHLPNGRLCRSQEHLPSTGIKVNCRVLEQILLLLQRDAGIIFLLSNIFQEGTAIKELAKKDTFSDDYVFVGIFQKK